MHTMFGEVTALLKQSAHSRCFCLPLETSLAVLNMVNRSSSALIALTNFDQSIPAARH